MFDNDIFIPHFYIMLVAELQVMKKKSKPGEIYSFSPYPVYIRKMSLTTTFSAPVLAKKTRILCFPIIFFVFFDHFFYFKRF